ncbi:hypothetical protein SAMN04244560_00868 [Thermoanaerobacter thermohydrosulfuricus]|uniref:Uncharacterized protein n=1 Tax=Thermoanaerobacter thermohydrosulfuricus TaxID=1516 RepID=A0A1G7LUR3_THETY|nr:hypothetical protein [Thermoanaerobacter thermohydrosulfuricus]SDF52699.1 hypothetical protein SAMN04244560_00868 [Thermoanaerobacter thermohydrosulfuricus]
MKSSRRKKKVNSVPASNSFSPQNPEIAETLLLSADEEDSIQVIKTEDLTQYSTICGIVGNQPFTYEVVSFMKNNNIDHIIALCDNEKNISYFYIPLETKDRRNYAVALRIETMINKNGGSVRLEEGGTYFSFESE